MARTEQWAETGVGAIVLAAAGVFLAYALSHSGGLGGSDGYLLKARFGEAGSLAAGADVRVAGVKVGSVEKVELDPKTFLAVTTLRVNQNVKLPDDSSVKVTSDGLLGGQHVSIAPGGSPKDLAAGGEFQNTQGAVDLFGLIGQVIRPQGTGAPAADANAAPATAAKPNLRPKSADPYPDGN